MNKIKERTRLMIQLLFTALTNGYVSGFLGKKLYKGNLKQFCVPGLNCYSCPGALGSCPIGALQAVAGDRNYLCTGLSRHAGRACRPVCLRIPLPVRAHTGFII